MHRRHQHLNIPIEIVRTAMAISETGSISKAGERLGLSQPAVSSQIRRLQNLVGGSLFEKSPNGTTVTELGKLALQQARKILEANDQLLRLGGNNSGPLPLRLGLSTSFIDEFVGQKLPELGTDVFVHADHSASIGKGLLDGYIDIACIFDNAQLDPEVKETVTHEYEVQLAWIRSKDFVLSPGAPIPIITDSRRDWIIPTLTKRNLSYKIVLNSPDDYARLAAVKAGFGLTVVPARTAPPGLMIAKEYYLPQIPPITALLCQRPGLEPQRSKPLIKHLQNLFVENATARDVNASGDERVKKPA